MTMQEHMDAMRAEYALPREQGDPPRWTRIAWPAHMRSGGLCHEGGLWWWGPDGTWCCGTCYPQPWRDAGLVLAKRS